MKKRIQSLIQESLERNNGKFTAEELSGIANKIMAEAGRTTMLILTYDFPEAAYKSEPVKNNLEQFLKDSGAFLLKKLTDTTIFFHSPEENDFEYWIEKISEYGKQKKMQDFTLSEIAKRHETFMHFPNPIPES